MTALEDIYRVLAEFPEEARAREQGAFDEIAGSRAKLVVLWGAGNLGRRLAAAMRAAGFSPLSFCDRNAQLQGSEVDGIPVISVEAAVARWGREAAFVVAIWHGAAPQGMADRIEQLQSLGCECVCSFVPLAWKLSARLLPFYACDLPSRLLENADALRALANALDDESQRVLAAQLRWRLRGDFHGIPAPAPDQYFPRDVVRPIEEEVFVDAGAFFFAGPIGLAVTKGYNFGSIFQGSGGSSSIGELFSDWKVERGVAQAGDVAMATKKNRVALKGSIDFANDQFDDVTIALIDAHGRVRVKQKIHGPFQKPVVEKPSVLLSLAGPTLNLLRQAGDLVTGGTGEVFYAGSVPAPK